MPNQNIKISYSENADIVFSMLHQKYSALISQPFTHAHSDYQISRIVSGTGTYNIDGKEFEIKPGNILIIKAGQNHFISYLEDNEPIHIDVIHFRTQFLSNPLSPFDSAYVTAFTENNRNSNLIPAESPYAARIAGHITDIQNEVNMNQPFLKQAIKAELMTILCEISRALGIAEHEPEITVQSPRISDIIRSMDYIDKHLMEDITLDQLAASAGLSKSYYSHVFKEYNGVSPIDFIIDKRIDLSRGALKRTNDSIINIAKRYGFNNAANYNRAFKMKTGMTPSEFRKASRSNPHLLDWE